MKRNHEEDLLGKQLLRQFMRDLLTDEVQDEKRSKGKSFAFLDNQLLNMLMLYFLMHWEKYMADEKEHKETIHAEPLLTELDNLLAEDQKNFDEVISLLKK
ncbi:hypothetical protein [Halobacillus massiliensis]|uniref:hypothetical protein n=1 Tax=Halobacillus massiliensis TaxID=1926286 RepID=UPI0009E3B405|nr:hypothetical protein [Halobacillus massiliensis]